MKPHVKLTIADLRVQLDRLVEIIDFLEALPDGNLTPEATSMATALPQDEPPESEPEPEPEPEPELPVPVRAHSLNGRAETLAVTPEKAPRLATSAAFSLIKEAAGGRPFTLEAVAKATGLGNAASSSLVMRLKQQGLVKPGEQRATFEVVDTDAEKRQGLTSTSVEADTGEEMDDDAALEAASDSDAQAAMQSMDDRFTTIDLCNELTTPQAMRVVKAAEQLGWIVQVPAKPGTWQKTDKLPVAE